MWHLWPRVIPNEVIISSTEQIIITFNLYLERKLVIGYIKTQITAKWQRNPCVIICDLLGSTDDKPNAMHDTNSTWLWHEACRLLPRSPFGKNGNFSFWTMKVDVLECNLQSTAGNKPNINKNNAKFEYELNILHQCSHCLSWCLMTSRLNDIITEWEKEDTMNLSENSCSKQ